MDLSPYLDQLRRDLAASAAAGSAEVARAGELLGTALEASARLCLMEALADAAAEITASSGAVNVEVRLRGRDAHLVVSENEPETEPPGYPAAPPPPGSAGAPADSGDLARITLRLPEALKEQVERAAGSDGTSVNSWLVRAITQALAGGRPGPGPTRTQGRRVTGWAQA
jgi:hypothetical protein